MALEWPGGTLSFEQLDRVSGLLCEHLHAQHGIGAGHMVALAMPRSALLVLTELALIRLGATFVPLDMAAPDARLQGILGRLPAGPLLVSEANPRWAALGGAPVVLDGRWLDVEWAGMHAPTPYEQADKTQWAEVSDDVALCVMFTSGSTGVPKGVMVPGAGVARLAQSCDAVHLAPGQRWAFLASPSFDAALYEVWVPLMTGGTCVVQEATLPALDELARFLVSRAVSDAFLTTSLFNAMVEDQCEGLSGLQQLIIGGERASPSHVTRFQQQCPRVALVNGYGPTENSVFTLFHRALPNDAQGPLGLPIGQALPGTCVRLVPLEEVDGLELWCSGLGVAMGYLGAPELTREKFVEDQGQRWYRTGDLVKAQADGSLLYVGRADRQVKIQGHRIELDEVELRLASCAGVSESVVGVVGESSADRHLAVVYKPAEGQRPSEADVQRHLAKFLPPGALPRRYICKPDLPTLSSGKIDRKGVQLWLNRLNEPRSLSALLHDSFSASAPRLALSEGGQSLTYAALSERADVLAAQLRQAGVRPADLVPLLMPRSIDLIVSMLAVWRCGAAYVPVDPASAPHRQALILDKVRPKLVLVDDEVDTAALAWPVLNVQGQAQPQPADPCDWGAPLPEAEWPDDALAYVMFTSGSTGQPKGVCVTRGNVAALFHGQTWAAMPADARWLFATSPSFDISVIEIWGALLHGACAVVLRDRLASLDRMAQFCVAERITHAQWSTTVFNLLVDARLDAFAGLQQVLTGGERASARHMRRLLLAHPQLVLINCYGPTETTVWSLTHAVTLADTYHPEGVTIGRAIRGTVVRIDGDSPQEGQLLIGGAGVTQGYLEARELTHAQFFSDEAGVRWYRTGDVVRVREDGTLTYVGRNDRQVKIRSQRIELDEVEVVLSGCTGVQQVAVWLLERPGQVEPMLVGAYSVHAGEGVDVAAVMAHGRSRLPAAALPEVLQLVEQMPLNASGKIDRPALKSGFSLGQAPSSTDLVADQVAWLPHEAQLAAVWETLWPGRVVSRADDFLRLGGTSLLALKLADLVQAQLGKLLTPLDILRHPSLVDQARHLEGLPEVLPQVSDEPQLGRPFSLAVSQTALLDAGRIDPSGSAYLVHVALILDASLNESSWQSAFVALSKRHELLRLRVAYRHTAWQAHVHSELPANWWQTHGPLGAMPEDLCLPDECMARINLPMDTEHAGVMRVDVWPLGTGQTFLVWTVHHAVIDEVAIDAALAELGQLLAGEPLSPLVGNPTAMADRERARTDHAGILAQADALADRLSNARPPLPSPPADGTEVRMLPAAGWSQRLQAAATQWECSPFPILLAAYGSAVQSVFGPVCAFVATPFSRRCDPDMQQPLSYCLDVRLIEAGARGQESASQHLARVRKATLQAMSPSVISLDGVAAQLATRAPAAAAMLTQFGLTWRLAPSRSLRLGSQAARLIRVQQTSARFAICLHAALVNDELTFSIEAVNAAHQQGLVGALWRAFEARLEALLQSSPEAMLEEPSATLSPADALKLPVLRQLWAQWLSLDEGALTQGSHLLRLGGSSLMAMRMAAQLRQQHRLQLDVSAFLARPTLARMCECATQLKGWVPEHCVLVGEPDANQLVLMLPGRGGHALGLMRIAHSVRKNTDGRVAVAVLDLDGLLQGVGTDAQAWPQVLSRISAAAEALGLERIQGIAGFSLGGLLALNIANTLFSDRPLRVWLLDASAPRTVDPGLVRRLERKLAAAWRRVRSRGLPENHGTIPEVFDSDEEISRHMSRDFWDELERQAAFARCDAPQARVHLVQARGTLLGGDVIWRRSTNAFDPAAYGGWQLTCLPGEHLDLHRGMAETAGVIIGKDSG